MIAIDINFKKRTLQRLSRGITTAEELKNLIVIYGNIYKTTKHSDDYITYQLYKELLRRLESSIFNNCVDPFPIDLAKYYTFCEYSNTKLFINSLKKLLKVSQKIGDLTNPEFYGLLQTKYKLSIEAVIHIFIRHNKILNGFISQDSISNGHDPSSFKFGLLSEPMLILFNLLTLLSDKKRG